MGLKVLSETEIFDGRTNLGQIINREFRELLSLYFVYRDRFDGFLEEISVDVLDTIANLVRCDVVLEDEFEAEVTRDLQRAHSCAGLTPDEPEAPVPIKV